MSSSEGSHDLSRLDDFGRALKSELRLDKLLYRVLEHRPAITGARFAAIGVLDPERIELERFITYGAGEATRRSPGARPGSVPGASPRGHGAHGLHQLSPRRRPPRTIAWSSAITILIRSGPVRSGAGSGESLTPPLQGVQGVRCFTARRDEQPEAISPSPGPGLRCIPDGPARSDRYQYAIGPGRIDEGPRACARGSRLGQQEEQRRPRIRLRPGVRGTPTAQFEERSNGEHHRADDRPYF
jgi:hypothetical protein